MGSSVALDTLEATWTFLLGLQCIHGSCTYQILLLQPSLAAVGVVIHHLAGNPWSWDHQEEATPQLQVTLSCHVQILKPGLLVWVQFQQQS